MFSALLQSDIVASLEAVERALSALPPIVAATIGTASDGALHAEIGIDALLRDAIVVDEILAGWSNVFETTFAAPGEEDALFDITGWQSAVDPREPLERAVMRRWVDATVARIAALGARSTLEIGCGTGLLLARLAPSSNRYVATDFSAAVLARVRANLGRAGLVLPQLELLRRAANDFAGIEGTFDAVVLNSVVQYFPSAAYLGAVWAGAAARLRAGGTLFVGDVRARALLPALHAEAPELGDRRDLRRRVDEDAELVLEPAAFRALAASGSRIGAVRALLKRGPADELTRYRFDVLALAGAPEPLAARELRWSPALLEPPPRLEEPALVVRDVPNARVAGRLARAAGLLGEPLAEPGDAVDPETLCAAYEAAGLWVEPRIARSGDPARFDLTVMPAPPAGGAAWLSEDRVEPARERADLAELASQPVLARLQREAVPRWKRALRERFGEAAVPLTFALRFAEAPAGASVVELPAAADPGDVGTVVRTAWCDLLALDEVRADDDWYELGGHSLIATQLIARVRAAFGVEVALAEILARPRFADMLEAVAAALEHGAAQAPAPVPAPRAPAAPLPLSFGQERLWFVHALWPADPVYNVPLALRWDGPLDVAVLNAALAAAVARHEPLRTRFAALAGVPSQLVGEPWPIAAEVVDLGACDRPAFEAAVRAGCRERARVPFDLGQGRLLRATVFRGAGERHAVLLVTHHIATDGWSVAILHRELILAYEALRAGRPAPLAPLALHYADFALWQRGDETGPERRRQLAYWAERLRGAPAVLELPADRRRPAAARHRGALHRFALDPGTAEAVARTARALGCTPFALLCAAFAAWVHRVSGRDDVLIGTPVANRTRVEFEPLIGFFVNTLVLRTRLAGEPTFAQFLAAVRETALGALAHQDVPFERVVEELAPERDLTRAPLVQVVFAVQNAPVSTLAPAGVTLDRLDVDHGVAKFDLAFTLETDAAGLSGLIEYDADLFDASRIALVAEQYRTLLAGALADPHAALHRLPLIGPAERALLDRAGATEAPFPAAATVHELVARQAALTPAAPAVAAPDGNLGYGELLAAASALTRRLRAAGIGPGDLVAVALPRSARLIVTLLGILRAGAAYVPLDANAPPERHRLVLADARCALVVTDRASRERVPAGTPVLVLDDPPAAAESAAAIAAADSAPAEAAAAVHPLSAAYVVYTSGSTGRPKGVVCPHRAIVRLATAAAYCPLGPGDRVAQSSTFAFDAFTFEVWSALIAGATTVVLPTEALLDADRLGELLRRERIGVMFLTTTVFHTIARQRPDAFAGLRTLLVGGESLDPRAAAAVLDGAPPARLLNMYGPTEATTFATWHRIERADAERWAVPIGVPLQNTAIEVRDERGEEAAVGVVGELLLGGPGLALGYLNAPRATAAAFVPAPGGARWYRSGDFVRRLADGRLEFVGRRDGQVKLRGFRLELDEIEGVLREVPLVDDAVVVLDGAAASGPRLVAYVAGRADVRAVLEHLHRRLPSPAIPTHYVPLEAFPVGSTGKVDRAALLAANHPPQVLAPAPSTAGAAGEAEAEDPVADAVRAIWTRVLGHEVGLDDNFFTAGGHSLLLTQIVAALRSELGVDLPLRALFEAPDLRALARRVEDALLAGLDAQAAS
ncbi:MAG: hypothetical protein QOI11_747 [Candidatus Eremiobacteraeota bacterium]|nr:hypothetical protein [Candidatus Eremiobacteraeota bacterium]